MLKYLIVMLNEASVSFCHYEQLRHKDGEISVSNLKAAILLGMKENLSIQFVYPNHSISSDLEEIVESIDHIKIKPYPSDKDDILVADINNIPERAKNEAIVIRTSIKELLEKIDEIEKIVYRFKRVNIIFKAFDSLSDEDIVCYKNTLDRIADYIVSQTKKGKELPQLNILTDRIMLDKMNNCGAGDESITLAPDGKLYICPAFYFDGEQAVEWKDNKLQLPNAQLYRLEYAPICRACDAFQCHRCVWQNKRRTLEVNTPGHIQCVQSHIERNASRRLLENLREIGVLLPGKEIKEIDYLDPFDKINKI